MQNISIKDFKESSLQHKNIRAAEGLKKARNFIYFALSLFCIGIVIGFVYSESFRPLLLAFERFLQYRFEGRGTLLTIVLIFFQNFTAAIISILFGVLLGIVPFFSAILNGVIIGALSAELAGANQLNRLWGLVPHGVFELPAIFMAWGLGLWHGAWLLRNDKSETLANRRNSAMLTFLRYGLPLLIIAAIIEGLLIKSL
jgi:uncharacterized membrane protein SpoIIM required for sporulation